MLSLDLVLLQAPGPFMAVHLSAFDAKATIAHRICHSQACLLCQRRKCPETSRFAGGIRGNWDARQCSQDILQSLPSALSLLTFGRNTLAP